MQWETFPEQIQLMYGKDSYEGMKILVIYVFYDGHGNSRARRRPDNVLNNDRYSNVQANVDMENWT